MMKLVIDTNVLIAALLKDSVTRELLLSPSMEFLLPEFALEEIKAHGSALSRRSGLTLEEIDLILSVLLERVSIVRASQIKPYMKRADRIVGDKDPLDAPFVALALATSNDGIWSNDRHFAGIKEIKVWRTRDLLSLRS